MPEIPENIKNLADTMTAKFTPPQFVPGCEVKSIADIDEYTTNNGWIEAIVGGDNQQRVRYYGTPAGVAVDDLIDVEYFPDYKLYRVFGSSLGGTASVGGIKTDRLWDSNFGTVALEADASGNLTINGVGFLYMPTVLAHVGDTDTRIAFSDDLITISAGNKILLRLTETTQDLIEIGDVVGGGDVDINFNNDQMFLQGSSGRLGVDTITPGAPLDVGGGALVGIAAATALFKADSDSINGVAMRNTNTGTSADYRIAIADTAGDYLAFTMPGVNNNLTLFGANRNTICGLFTTTNRDLALGTIGAKDIILGTNNLERMRIESGGNIVVGTTAASAKAHIDQASTTAAIPVLYLDQADVSEEMIEFNTTIGTGNAIEAVGAKTLTTTHFIKVTLPGALTRYIPVGTIA